MNTEIITIKEVAYPGHGVGHLASGKVCFVPFTLPGEEVEVKVTDEKKSLAFARVVKVHKASDSRINPVCTHAFKCGGCQYLHMDYEQEVALKQEQLKTLLKRIAGIEDILPKVVPSPNHDHYRRSLKVHVNRKHKVGFFSANRERLIDVQQCLLADPMLNAVLKDRREELVASNLGEVELKTDGQAVGFGYHPQPLTYSYGKHRIGFDSGNFFQTNFEILTEILGYLEGELPGADVLFDMYCGVGVFGIALEHKFEQIIGVEHSRKSAEWARKNAEGLNKTRFVKGKVENKLGELYRRYHGKSNVLICDPPRRGLAPRAREAILDQNAWKAMAYISCDPGTLSRDIKAFCDTGKWKVASVALFDMFPRTYHFETVAILLPNK